MVGWCEKWGHLMTHVCSDRLRAKWFSICWDRTDREIRFFPGVFFWCIWRNSCPQYSISELLVEAKRSKLLVSLRWTRPANGRVYIYIYIYTCSYLHIYICVCVCVSCYVLVYVALVLQMYTPTWVFLRSYKLMTVSEIFTTFFCMFETKGQSLCGSWLVVDLGLFTLSPNCASIGDHRYTNIVPNFLRFIYGRIFVKYKSLVTRDMISSNKHLWVPYLR